MNLPTFQPEKRISATIPIISDKIQIIVDPNEEEKDEKMQPGKKKLIQAIIKRTYRKNVSKITDCEHVDAQFYSKGLCKNCYHKRGRVKLATGCQHKARKLYAR